MHSDSIEVSAKHDWFLQERLENQHRFGEPL